MSLISSKKKIVPSDACLEALSNQNLNGLKGLIKLASQNSISFKTPSKRLQNTPNNRRVAQMKWNDLSTVKQNRYKHLSSQKLKQRPNISVIKTRIEIKKRQISKLAQEYRRQLQIIEKSSKLKIQTLLSQKLKEEFKQLIDIKQQNVKELKEMISQMDQEQQDREQQIQRLESDKEILQHKLKMCQQTKLNQEQRQRNIVYAVESQMKKNNILKNKLQEQRSRYSSSKIIQKLAHQLFTILILHYQIKNCKEINKRQSINVPKVNNKRKGGAKQINQIQINNVKEFSMNNQLKLCLREFNTGQQNKKAQDRKSICIQLPSQKCQKPQKYQKCQVREKNKQMLHKLPFALVVICSTYIQLKLKDVDRKYFNKISYFCDKIKTIFDYERFSCIVEDFFTQRKNQKLVKQTDESMHDVVNLQVGQNKSGRKYQQTKQEVITLDEQVQMKHYQQESNNEGQIRVIMKMSTNCVCGYQLSEALKNGNLQNLMKKYLNISIGSIQPSEECCSILEVQELVKHE